jgi:Flp pilus assembly pilin Flp
MSALTSVTGRLAALTMSSLASALVAADDEDGQAMTEYAVILTLISVVLVTALSGLRGAVVDVISNTTSYL